MRLSAVLNCVAFASMLTIAGAASAAPDPSSIRVSDPVRHDNLAVYFIHGPSKPGAVPLTLEEALAKGVVRLSETGNVNTLEIENFGDAQVFVQAGDVVKGGKQDRTLMVSLLLPPKSGRIPIASFCVEHGRWSPRGVEDAGKFSTSTASVPSREMKLAMQAPLAAAPSNMQAVAETGLRQQKVWDGVQAAQQRLSVNTGVDVRAPASGSSLQLALENEKLAEARKAYVATLTASANDDDIVGYVFAINGKLNSGDVYSSNALFKKMWPKLLTASAVEAIGHRQESSGEPPPVKDVMAFLAGAEAGTASAKPLNFGVNRVTHASPAAYMFETAKPDGWVHKNYLAK
jgi:cytochrome c biogenesis protein ResB